MRAESVRAESDGALRFYFSSAPALNEKIPQDKYLEGFLSSSLPLRMWFL